MGAPSAVPPERLRELHVKLELPKPKLAAAPKPEGAP